MNISKSTALGLSIGAIIAGSAFLIGCSNSGSTGFQPPFTVSAVALNAHQVEQFARPAINEGVFISNDFLNGYNSIEPNQQLAVLTNPAVKNGAGTTILAEASTYLQALAVLGGDQVNADKGAGRFGDEVAALFPDVQRIDMSFTSPSIGSATGGAAFTQAYANKALIIDGGKVVGPLGVGVEGIATRKTGFPVVMPIGGRKMEDDAVDDTYALLTNGAVPGDNVSFDSATPQTDNTITATNAGAVNSSVGHHFLRGQGTTQGGACNDATQTVQGVNGAPNAEAFPYEADPN